MAWSVANTAAAKLGTLAIGVVLARVLGPEAFGTYAIAYVALVAVLSFNELGVSLAIVRWPGDAREIAPTVSTVSLASSVLVTAGAFAVAPAFATTMGDPSAANLVRVLALCVVINGAVAAPAALMQRAFRQDQRMLVDQVNTWLGAGVSVALALVGVGAWALVIGRLAGAVVSAVLFVALSPEPYRLALDRSRLRPLLAFGLPLAGASVVVFAASYVDQLVVGRVLGPVALGFYVLAFNLSSWPVTVLSQPLRSVAPALFARLQDNPAQMRRTFTRVLRPLAAVTLPMCVVLSAVAEDVVHLVYGEAWAPAAEPLRWLALLAAARILIELAYDYLVVLGRSRRLFAVQALWLVMLVPATSLGAAGWGTQGVAVAQVVVAALVVVPVYLVLLRRELVGLRHVVRQVAVPLGGSLALGAVVAWSAWQVSSPLGTLAGAAVAGLSTVVALGWRSRDDLRALRDTSSGLGS
ncbi:lipopolysaccharide biosynthesis protein [uncultured Cellulomonas sp.]|uniref:lipopolysaccharide biosynthesis protein n=1 Tax=uncultured Cellulomonas sp. TaxID=189682 RepID=UPI00260A70E1|nr:lipopolysaccharide biosynthesis protein [uncultured Cellulomonas sp.]